MRIQGLRVVRSFRATEWTSEHPHMLRVTEDRSVWLDPQRGDRVALAGELRDGQPITRAEVRRAVNL